MGAFNSSIVVERKMSPVDLDKTLSDDSDEERQPSDGSSPHSSSEDENQGLKLRMSDKKLEMQLNKASALNPLSYESEEKFFSKANEVDQLKAYDNIDQAYNATSPRNIEMPRTMSQDFFLAEEEKRESHNQKGSFVNSKGQPSSVSTGARSLTVADQLSSLIQRRNNEIVK